jgi:2-hydroxychromene-2-carboxylate isomerase
LPLFPLRLTLLSTCNNDLSLQEHLIDAIYSSLWGDSSGYGINPTEAEFTRVASAALPPQPSGLSIDQFASRAKSDAAKQELKSNGDEAVKLGVFGVPSMIVYPPGGDSSKRPELFWGNDQLGYVEMIINGKGGVIEVSPEYEQALRTIPVAATRPQSKL